MTTTSTEIAHAERAHSSIVGGSSADKRLNCPGSYQKEQKLPEKLRSGTSSFAEEGTALHEAMEFVLTEGVEDLGELIGMTFNGYEMTKALIEDGVVPALEAYDEIEDSYADEGGIEYMLELRCAFPDIPDAFGTCDVAGRTEKRTIILDWKFGVGVPVYAVYTEEDGSPRVNGQLLFYACAVRNEHPELFGDADDWPVDLYIVQPRTRETYADGKRYSKASVSNAELDRFEDALIAAIAEAQGDNPRTKRGPWCRFADCKAICEHFTGPLLDLGKLDLTALRRNKPGVEEPVVKTDWGDLFAAYLPVCDVVEEVIKAIRAQAHGWLEQGQAIDGFKLVPKRATENYVDEAGARRHAMGLGLTEEDITEPGTLKSPAQLRAVLEPKMDGKTKKERTEEAKRQIATFTAAVSSGTTLAKEDDSRPSVTPTPLLMQDLAKKLAGI